MAGKTCMFRRFADKEVPAHNLGAYEPTVGADNAEQMMQLEGVSQDIRLQMVDTAGDDKYRRHVTSSYYSSTHAVILVYDVNSKNMWEKVPEQEHTPTCEEWWKEIEQFAHKDAVKFLVGTKGDDITARAAEESVIKQWAEAHGMAHHEISSKTGDGFEQLLQALAKHINAKAGKVASRSMKMSESIESDSPGPRSPQSEGKTKVKDEDAGCECIIS